jgi:putative SbcD/Mre11-related phosphoesterase
VIVLARKTRVAGSSRSFPAVPVVGERALLYSPRGAAKSLVVGDLHIGIETEFAYGGVKLPSATESMVERLRSLEKKTGAEQLVIAGDLKHSVQGVSAQEEQEVPAFFEEVAGMFEEVVLVPGNHDGGIGALLPKGKPNLRLAPVGGELLRGGLLVIHGHAWPSPALATKAKAVAVAHNHTAVALQDAMGAIAKEPCWARARVNPERWRAATGAESYPEVILMPPFNVLCTGVALNLAGGRPIGPLLKEGCVDLAGAQVYLLDGVHLGSAGALTLSLGETAMMRLTRGVSEDL